MERGCRTQRRDLQKQPMTKIFLLLFVGIVLSYATYECVRILSLLKVSGELVAKAVPFQRLEGSPSLLILGDSTAVGVGAQKPEDTVAGRIAARYPSWRVENHAVSGARVRDVEFQLSDASETHYERTIVHIGANDIIRFLSAEEAVAMLKPVLVQLRSRSGKVIFVTAGDIGATELFPWVLRPFYHYRTMQYHREFERIARETDTTYVNLYIPAANDPFKKDPARYHAPDGLHVSSDGYELWFEKISAAL